MQIKWHLFIYPNLHRSLKIITRSVIYFQVLLYFLKIFYMSQEIQVLLFNDLSILSFDFLLLPELTVSGRENKTNSCSSWFPTGFECKFFSMTAMHCLSKLGSAPLPLSILIHLFNLCISYSIFLAFTSLPFLSPPL